MMSVQVGVKRAATPAGPGLTIARERRPSQELSPKAVIAMAEDLGLLVDEDASKALLPKTAAALTETTVRRQHKAWQRAMQASLRDADAKSLLLLNGTLHPEVEPQHTMHIISTLSPAQVRQPFRIMKFWCNRIALCEEVGTHTHTPHCPRHSDSHECSRTRWLAYIPRRARWLRDCAQPWRCGSRACVRRKKMPGIDLMQLLAVRSHQPTREASHPDGKLTRVQVL